MAKDELDSDGSGAGLPVGLIVGGVLGAALALFVVQNSQDTDVQFLTFEFRQPLWIVLLITAAVTLVITELLGAARRRRKRKG